MAQGVDTSNLEAAQKKYDELKQPYDKLVEQRGAIRDEQQRLYEETRGFGSLCDKGLA